MKVFVLCEDSIYSYPVIVELLHREVSIEACVCADLKDTGGIVEALCNKFSIPLYNNKTIYQALQEGKIGETDIGFSYGYKRRILEELYTFPLNGIINFHPAPLPEFKGKAAYVHGYLKCVQEWGVVAHYIDEGFDTGPIIKKRMFPVDYEKIRHGLDFSEMARNELFTLFQDVLHEVIQKGAIQEETVEPKKAAYFSQKDLDCLKEIKDDDSQIDRKIKALWGPPYEGAYIYIGDKKYYLIDKDILEEYYLLWLMKKKQEMEHLYE